MNQKSNKLTVPDLISVGVFTALYFVLVTVATFACVLLPGVGNILLPAVAALIAVHHDLPPSAGLEARLLYLADKLVQGSEPTCLEARFAASRKKCETPSARAAWERRYRAARDILDEYQLNWGQTQ